jgi:hypothetical protein
MSEAIPNLIAASKEFDQELVAITATIAKAKQGVAELIVEKTVLSDKLYAALKYIEDTKPAPPTLPPQENVIKTKIVFKASQENKGWGDAIFYNKGETESTLSNQVIVCGGRSGIINNKGVAFAIDWKNLVFTQGPYQTGWGCNLNDVSGDIIDCTFVSLGDRAMVKEPHPTDGHPIYLKPSGDMLLEGNRFLYCGGNVQLVDRPWENTVPEKLTLRFKDNFWSNCSWNPVGHGGGGSSNIAIYAGTNEGTKVFIEDCIWHNAIPWIDYNTAKSEASSRACLTLWNEAYFPSTSVQQAGHVPDPLKHFSVLVFKNSLIRTTQGDRALIDIEATHEIYIKGIEIDLIGTMDTRPFITIDKRTINQNPQQAKRILIEPIDADGFMEIKGKFIPLREGYDWTEPGYTPKHGEA